MCLVRFLPIQSRIQTVRSGGNSFCSGRAGVAFSVESIYSLASYHKFQPFNRQTLERSDEPSPASGEHKQAARVKCCSAAVSFYPLSYCYNHVVYTNIYISLSLAELVTICADHATERSKRGECVAICSRVR